MIREESDKAALKNPIFSRSASLLLAMVIMMSVVPAGLLVDNHSILNVPQAMALQSAINLSSNAGSSLIPQVALAAGTNNVYVAWQDNTPGNNDIFSTS